MTHGEAYRKGKITKKQYRELSALKNFGHTRKYKKRERELGI
jgi:hypothetical protein